MTGCGRFGHDLDSNGVCHYCRRIIDLDRISRDRVLSAVDFLADVTIRWSRFPPIDGQALGWVDPPSANARRT